MATTNRSLKLSSKIGLYLPMNAQNWYMFLQGRNGHSHSIRTFFTANWPFMADAVTTNDWLGHIFRRNGRSHSIRTFFMSVLSLIWIMGATGTIFHYHAEPLCVNNKNDVQAWGRVPKMMSGHVEPKMQWSQHQCQAPTASQASNSHARDSKMTIS